MRRLFFPQTGVYPVPVTDPDCASRLSWGLGFSLDPRHAVVAVSCSATPTVEEASRLPTYSVSLGIFAERVVVPPDLTDEYSPNEVISHVTTLRTGMEMVVEETKGLREAVQSMLARVGGGSVDGVGRIQPA